MKKKVTVQTSAKKIVLETDKGVNLLHLLRENNINVTSPCGGNRTCGKCKVKVKEGRDKLTGPKLKLLTEDEIRMGYRLACALTIIDDLEIELLEEGKLEIVTEGVEFKIDFNPPLKVHKLLDYESDEENTLSHLDILYRETSTDNIDLALLKEIPEIAEEKEVSLLKYRNKIISLNKGSIKKVFGLAVDIGTTTVAVYLINILTGEGLDVASFHNPQKRYGADVISRINYVQSDNEKLKEMQGVLITGLNQGIKDLCSHNRLESSDIYLMTVVGNTVMSHLLLGINPASLARAPYRPIFTNSLEISPFEIGLEINRRGIVQVLPAVSSYVGSDIIADLLVTDFSSEQWNLLIDIGTNGEIVLGNKRQLLACSAAAGSAFEGANITFGTAGVPGAISSFAITEGGEFSYETIATEPPVGICGSGLIDLVAEMIKNDILTGTGMFNENPAENILNKIKTYQGMKALEIVEVDSTAINRPILLTQKDVRELQLAKGAIAAGINILLKEAGILYQDIEKIYLAGGFGSFIKPSSACKIGLLPKDMEDKIIKIGNGAGLGARNYLLDKTQREKTTSLLARIEYLELSLRKDFQEEFMKSMEF
ncbi:ASKHA domain-containing protein [Halocella sp. SP3-1]|uniref:ASKHA domain-containing protein n=1 Tax=Halocella sp. SP3-1 TaxID=2382161 RepID=UPI000F754BD0|nr:ASKHA domain-containing protein [Halocella sp. SP3-1]AZO93652.1 DUF4445 domain-containing protein [Halocella sp. SP3-1]